MKRFLLSSIIGGLCWILCSLFLIFLRNSDFFSILIGLQFAVGIGISTYFGSFKFKMQDFFISIIFITLFLFTLFSLVRITSGRVVLTCMVLILSFLVFQKGINDWRKGDMLCK